MNKFFNLNVDYKESFELKGWIKAKDSKFYKYNYVINNIYYCHNNIIIDSKRNVIKDYIEKEKYIVIDYFVLDIVNKELFLYDNRLKDSFIDDIDIKK